MIHPQHLQTYPIGYEHSEVKAIQRLLNHYSAEQISEDGVVGPATITSYLKLMERVGIHTQPSFGVAIQEIASFLNMSGNALRDHMMWNLVVRTLYQYGGQSTNKKDYGTDCSGIIVEFLRKNINEKCPDFCVATLPIIACDESKAEVVTYGSKHVMIQVIPGVVVGMVRGQASTVSVEKALELSACCALRVTEYYPETPSFGVLNYSKIIELSTQS